jgi:hypothetical protein
VGDWTTAGHAELGEHGGDGFAMSRRAHVLVDVGDAAVGADIESPARCKGLIDVDDAIGLRRRPRRIAEDGIVDAKRLSERPVGFGCVDARRKVGNIERPNQVATLTE